MVLHLSIKKSRPYGGEQRYVDRIRVVEVVEILESQFEFFWSVFLVEAILLRNRM
jgi:hypothetical protein